MNNCKSCGAPLSHVDIKCNFCGTVILAEETAGELQIQELQKTLHKIEEDEAAKPVGKKVFEFFSENGKNPAVRKKIDAIMNSPMPSDPRRLLNFFIFCHGQASISVDLFDSNAKSIKAAWSAKAKIAHGQLKLMAFSDTEVLARIKEYEKIYRVTREIGLPVKVLLMLLLATSLVYLLIS
jgi:hypothetical protein